LNVPQTLSATQRTVVALLTSFSMISYLDRTIMSIAGPQMIRDFGISPPQMGSIYSAFVLGYALLMIPGGHLTDRIGPRRTLTLMGFFSAALTGLTIVAGKPGLGTLIGIVPALFMVRLGLGITTAPLYPACARMTANWIPMVYHARVQAIIIAGSSAGAAISPFVFTWIMLKSNWRIPFLAAAFATAGLTAWWFWFARDYPTSSSPKPTNDAAMGSQSWIGLFRDRNLILITLAYGALGYFQYIFFYWMYYYFGEVLHLGANASARYTTILFITEGTIMPLGGFVSDRLTRLYGPQFGRRMVPIAGLCLAATLTSFGTSRAGVVAVACLSLAFGLAASCEGPFWAAVTELAGNRVGGASSILNTGAQVGGFFAPILTPLLASRAGWAWGLHAGSLVAVCGAVAVYFVKIRPAVSVETEAKSV
jgi:MFS family permease